MKTLNLYMFKQYYLPLHELYVAVNKNNLSPKLTKFK